MKIKVFIENESGSNQKNIYDEKTLKFKKSVVVSRKYPYPYGFILNTAGEDGDNLDCFVLTKKELKTGQIVEAIPVGLLEQTETSWGKKRSGVEEEDHNVLATLSAEEYILNNDVEHELKDFVSHVFDHIKDKRVTAGSILDSNLAIDYIKRHQD